MVTTGTVLDYWDTIDDYNNGVAGLPTSVVPGWTNNDCGGIDTISTSADDGNVWKDITTTDGTAASNCATTPANCSLKDKITGLSWSSVRGSARTWSQAINDCDALTFNGQTDWRLPTQKEWMEAYAHNVRSASTGNWITEGHMSEQNFWSGSSYSSHGTYAWQIFLATGATANTHKLGTMQVVCVR